MRVKNLSRVAGNGRGEEGLDHLAIYQQRMAVLAVVIWRNGPAAARERALKRVQRSASESALRGGQSTGVIIAASQPRARISRRPICRELNWPRSGAGLWAECAARVDGWSDAGRIFPGNDDNSADERLKRKDGGGEQRLARRCSCARRGRRPGKQGLVCPHARRLAGCEDEAAEMGGAFHKMTIAGRKCKEIYFSAWAGRDSSCAAVAHRR